MRFAMMWRALVSVGVVALGYVVAVQLVIVGWAIETPALFWLAGLVGAALAVDAVVSVRLVRDRRRSHATVVKWAAERNAEDNRIRQEFEAAQATRRKPFVSESHRCH